MTLIVVIAGIALLLLAGWMVVGEEGGQALGSPVYAGEAGVVKRRLGREPTDSRSARR